VTVTALDDLDALFTSAEAAKLLRLSQRTLERFRTADTGPRFRVLGRAVRYTGRDLREYVERCARRSTSELGPRP
jgi:Helix-turn-helix domain